MKNSLYLLSLLCVILGVSTVYMYGENKQLEVYLQNQYAQQLAIASEEIGSLNTALYQSTILQDEQALNEQLLAVYESSNKIKSSLSAVPVLQQQADNWLHYMTEIESLAGQTIKEGSYDKWQQQSIALADQFYSLEDEWNVLTTSFFQHASSLDDYVKNTTDFDPLTTSIKSYTEQTFPVTASESDYEKKKSLKDVQAEPISKQQAIDVFHRLFPELQEAQVTVTVNEDDAPYEFYHLQFARGSRIGYVDILKNGGHLLSAMIDRPILERTATQQQAKENATAFLQANGYNDTEFVEVRENHEAWHFVFARVVDDVVIYPDTLQIKMAKDDASVMGISALEYIQKEQLPSLAGKDFDWSTFLSKNAKVEEQKLAVIEDEHYALTLCYEAIVTSKDDNYHTYRLFVDATNLQLKKIELLD